MFRKRKRLQSDQEDQEGEGEGEGEELSLLEYLRRRDERTTVSGKNKKRVRQYLLVFGNTYSTSSYDVHVLAGDPPYYQLHTPTPPSPLSLNLHTPTPPSPVSSTALDFSLVL